MDGTYADTCHRNAICLDKDAVSTNSTQLFQCVCPPGLIGNGIDECQIYAFQTKFSLIKTNQDAASFNVNEFKQFLLSSGAVPLNISPSRILVEVLPYTEAATTRRLLQQSPSVGSIIIKVTISSLTAEEQVNVTSSILVNNLNTDPSISVQSTPSSISDDYDALESPIETTSTGFRVSSVQYNESDSTWVVAVSYTSGAPNVLSSLYITKAGEKPYSSNVLNTFLISQHPCLVSHSVCCMLDYQARYQIGAFSANITEVVKDCNSNISSTNTLDLGFHPDASQYLIDHALDEFVDSWVERIGPGNIKLHIAQTDLSTRGIATKDPLENNQQGYLLSFFVGMTHFTMLPANAMSVSASQSKIQLSISSSLTFSFSTAQDSTILRYITLQIMQNKWMDSIIERKMQFVKVEFVLPVGLRQNMNTGLVPLNSIRFAISKTQPSRLDASAWTNPCFSSDGTSGMYDNMFPYFNQYNQAQQASCAYHNNLCTNPASSSLSVNILSSSVVSFYFPIGDSVVNETNLGSSPSPYYIYIYFQLSVMGQDGSVILSSLFAKAPLDMMVVNRACDAISSEVNLLSTTTIDIALGFIGTQNDWNTTMRVYPNINAGGAATNKTVIDASSAKAQSVQSNLLSLIVRGSPGLFSRESTSKYYINVEQLSVMHFLDVYKFAAIMAKVQNKVAYSVEADSATGKPRIIFAQVGLLVLLVTMNVWLALMNAE